MKVLFSLFVLFGSLNAQASMKCSAYCVDMDSYSNPMTGCMPIYSYKIMKFHVETKEEAKNLFLQSCTGRGKIYNSYTTTQSWTFTCFNSGVATTLNNMNCKSTADEPIK